MSRYLLLALGLLLMVVLLPGSVWLGRQLLGARGEVLGELSFGVIVASVGVHAMVNRSVRRTPARLPLAIGGAMAMALGSVLIFTNGADLVVAPTHVVANVHAVYATGFRWRTYHAVTNAHDYAAPMLVGLPRGFHGVADLTLGGFSHRILELRRLTPLG